MTNEQHNKYIAWTFLGHGAFQVLMMLLMAVMFYLMFSFSLRPGDPQPPLAMFGVMFAFMFVIQMLFTVPSLIAAYAMLKRKSWARMAAIVAGVLAAMHIPIGTAACTYSLWFFMGDSWKSIYPEGPGRNDPEPHQIAAADESRWAGYQKNEKGEITFQPVEPPDWR